MVHASLIKSNQHSKMNCDQIHMHFFFGKIHIYSLFLACSNISKHNFYKTNPVSFEHIDLYRIKLKAYCIFDKVQQLFFAYLYHSCNLDNFYLLHALNDSKCIIDEINAHIPKLNSSIYQGKLNNIYLPIILSSFLLLFSLTLPFAIEV